MVLCKYFQQNRCRYGNNCRFEHDIGGGAQRQLKFDTGGGGGRDNNRYKWTAQNNNNNSESQTNPEEIVSGLRQNIETWEQSKMWPFSCMALEKDQPCMPEFTDISADELRWEAYQAIKSGNLMAYTEKVKQLTEEYRSKHLLLKHPTTEIKNQLVQFINSYRQNKNTDSKSSFVKPSAFGGPGSSNAGSAFGGMTSTAAAASPGFGGQSSSSNLFRGQSAFGGQSTNSGSVFGGQSATFRGPSSFGGQNSETFGAQSNAGSIFSDAAKSSAFGTNPGSGSVMGQPATFGQTSSESIFGQSSSETPGSTPGFGQSGFGQTQSGTLFGQPQNQSATPGSGMGQIQNPTRNLFGKPEPPPASSSIFGASGFGASASAPGTSAFGTSGSGIQGQTTSDNTKNTVYTPLDQLTADEKAQFESDQFTPGRIPVKPPPRELVK
ncbi:hypothetical protein LOTGIDRAFT_174789 [Lottia gigantea]|uniref:Nucleoporin NUP42 n=1 Tax=Lottia gigantea TaxID=225164 RepID=V4C4V7_LOTGI|nr:hypothetical protein LOTGIDRAFT_174789 [Lottia gigantea]ESO96614.1 hypothetical protein LOTGIDRAFT_174789 [Lottia gigantea]